ncbi:hypothetical protein EDB71_101126 [Vibrio crassostreae]|nr:hypothetical protein EDB71_101126 [Vibrio crassostreae]
MTIVTSLNFLAKQVWGIFELAAFTSSFGLRVICGINEPLSRATQSQNAEF